MIFGINENTLTMYGTIWDYDGQEFVYYLNYLENKYSEITIRLHTLGGSVFAGNLMCNALERSNADITIIIDGLAASMGAIFILSSKKVKIVNNGYVMIHAPSSGSYGNAKDHESSAKLLRLMEENFEHKLILRTGKSKEEVRAWLNTDTWLSAQEALDLGLVSEIIPASIETVYPSFDPEELGETEVFNMYAALLTSVPTPAANAFMGFPKIQAQQPEQLNFNDNMKQLLISAFALKGVTAQSSDTAVVEALQTEFSNLTTAKTTAETAKTTAENKLKEFEDGRIKAIIDGAASGLGKTFTEDERKTYESIGATSGIDALELVFKNVIKPQPPNILAAIQTQEQKNMVIAGRDNWDFAQWQKEDPKGLEKMAVDEAEKFQALFNAKYSK
ncbi:head maturation protease, ClpP-related [Chryseobacterium sp. AG363]|uniref:head maturation protease, ClpP-related n=1 Tax=Chryseobacterium sp. AG363 TaxID=2183997 RepID=UPI000E70928D|nr:head maturation protease, ClpP-related [Chryseobacterium sp. AG363]RKE82003.1 ATP-dependent Clp endopeptidase proteolytic subunit ClpP [Chryseobacterium sp. AG363]